MAQENPFSTDLSSTLTDLACSFIGESRAGPLSAAMVKDAVDFCLVGHEDETGFADTPYGDHFLALICSRVQRGSLDPTVPLRLFAAVRAAAVALREKRVACQGDPGPLVNVLASAEVAAQRIGIMLGRLYANARQEIRDKEGQIDHLKGQMLKFVSKRGRGWVDVGGTRMCLLDVPSGWLSLAEAIQLFAGEDTYKRVFFEAGQRGTFLGTALERRIITRSPEGFREAVETFSSAGFGSFHIRELKFSDGFARISCPDAFEAWAFLQTGKTSFSPVCHYSTGVLLSFMEQISRRNDITATETKCIARGDSKCEFVVGTREQLQERGVTLPEWGMTIKEKAEYLENLLEENKKVQTAIRRKNLELSALNKIISTVSMPLDLQEVLDLAVTELHTIVPDKAVAIFVLDHEKQQLILAAQQGLSEEFVACVSQLNISEGLAGRVARERKPLAYDDYTQFPEALEAAARMAKVKSLLSVPLMSMHTIHGVLNVASTTPYHFPPEEISLMTLIGYQIGSAMERAQLHEDMKRNERLASIGRVSSILAHEIRNPLSSIKTNIQVLARKLDLEGFDKKRLDIALAEIRRLERVLKEMLDFARPMTMTKSERFIDHIIDRCLELLDGSLKSAGIKVIRKKARTKKSLVLDSEKIEEALLNILLNSIDAMPGGGTLQITTRCVRRSEERAVAVKIRDTGSGIAPEHLGKIFDPFFSAKTRGVGLGLTNVRSIIDAHGGIVEVESRVGEGTLFTITLPER